MWMHPLPEGNLIAAAFPCMVVSVFLMAIFIAILSSLFAYNYPYSL